MAGDRRKQSLYFPEGVLQEIEREAVRQDRSLSWILQQAWRIARDRIASMHGANDPVPPDPEDVPPDPGAVRPEAARPGDGVAA
jgi:uncharacterized small protein (TIGR04563 family)